ncbi:MAG: hypothetical protein ABJB03_00390 [Rhodoglobus sp.]
MKTAEQIRADGRAMTPTHLERISHVFRNEIGGLYEFVAATIEQQHPHARQDPAGYVELDSDREYSAWLEQLQPDDFHTSGMPTARVLALAHAWMIHTLADQPRQRARR